MREVIASYRVQVSDTFRFADLEQILPYLSHLGISHLYLSPVWRARIGSAHGYDVIDPSHVSDTLGGESGLASLAHRGFGIILDIVPNHMAADPSNPYWADESIRPLFFDIDARTGRHRRFFDIDDLVGVRMEDALVFEETHRKLRQLVGAGVVSDVRVDHIDGLAAPSTYLSRLASIGLEHIWVEKILGSGEELPNWPVAGTTGYDFLNDMTGIFVDHGSESIFSAIAEESEPFSRVAFQAKLEQAVTTFTPEVERLGRLFNSDQIPTALASLPIYRTYLGEGNEDPTFSERLSIGCLPEPIRSLFMDREPESREFIRLFQQISGAIMAKGVEDTAFYRYVRLLALNEVGGDPGCFGLSVDEFHRRNLARAQRFPQTLLASQTHDTKRSGDVRSRLLALTHQPHRWRDLVEQWRGIADSHRTGSIPAWSVELFIYQSLVGGWPIAADRLEPYLIKALREGKQFTDWIHPDERVERAVVRFCSDLLSDGRFRASFDPFVADLSLAGERISLAQLVLRMASPGIPDIYQGDENWSYLFVDPDNRRPVDWPSLDIMLGQLRDGARVTRQNAKLYTTVSMLALRRRWPRAFVSDYQPLMESDTTCAFRRGSDVVVAVALRDDPVSIHLPAGQWKEVLHRLRDAYSPTPVRVFERSE